MARRRQQLADKLTEGSAERRPGWRETIISGGQATEADPEPTTQPRRRTGRLRRKTYLLTPDLIARVEQLAHEEQVGINELVRFLLGEALGQAESEELPIPTRPDRRRIVP